MSSYQDTAVRTAKQEVICGELGELVCAHIMMQELWRAHIMIQELWHGDNTAPEMSVHFF